VADGRRILTKSKFEKVNLNQAVSIRSLEERMRVSVADGLVPPDWILVWGSSAPRWKRLRMEHLLTGRSGGHPLWIYPH